MYNRRYSPHLLGEIISRDLIRRETIRPSPSGTRVRERAREREREKVSVWVLVVWICGFNRWTEIVAAIDAVFVQVASIDGKAAPGGACQPTR